MGIAHPTSLASASGSYPSPLKSLGWAAYLACSWTWCIGMFLPVLLVRDYGIWGFVIFAVPNVIGAAAMGWVLRDRRASRRLELTHARALRVFSAITAAFQIAFVFWVLPMFFGGWTQTHLAIVAALVAAAVFALLSGVGAILLWLTSAVLLVLAWRQVDYHLLIPEPPLLEPGDAFWLAPVCVFGFLLCPYLDGTFHRARQQLGPRGPTGFGVGFGILFLAMILGTLSYAQTVGLAFEHPETTPLIPGLKFIGWHIVLQLAFTIFLHVKIVYAKPRRTIGLVALITAAALAALVAPFGWHSTSWGINVTEVGYRSFMAFYGLLFPAYVWLCMIPVRGEAHTQRPSSRKLGILAIACGLAAPFYWMGFIERESIWLVPGLAIVLLARRFVRPSTGAVSPAAAAT